MAINQLQAPINYMAMAPQVDLGGSFAELGQVLAQRQQRQQTQEAKQQFSNDLKAAQTDGGQNAWLNMIGKYPQFREAFGDVRKGAGEERLKTEFTQGFEISNALENKAPEVAIERVKTIIDAKKNSGESTKIYDDVLTALQNNNLVGAQSGVNFALIALDPDRFEKSVKARTTATEAPSKLREQIAKADQEVVKAQNAIATASDDVAKAKATRQFEEAKAKKEQIQADTELKTRLADLGFKQAQTNKFLVETRNLDATGKMLSLDFAAAAKGLPLPSKKAEGGGTATEDERKAAGWLAQGTNAYQNMLKAMYTKEGKATGAEKPGKIESLPLASYLGGPMTRSTDRQKFVQASSSLSEALLRAATGAGVNEAEAKQKLEEITPLFSDDEGTRKQKLASIPVYLESLKLRAGRAAPQDYQVPVSPMADLTFTLPSGIQKTFPDQKSLEDFKKAAGIK